jgi:protein-tyrosine phosphatase
VNQIRPNIWLGSWPDAGNHALLRRNGITAVLNVAIDHNDRPCDDIGWFKVGLLDGPGNPRSRVQLDIDTLGDLIAAEEHVYVHCVAGCSRAPYILARYLAHAEQRPFDEVWAELRCLRPKVWERSFLYGAY